jgi:hypothetical protein
VKNTVGNPVGNPVAGGGLPVFSIGRAAFATASPSKVIRQPEKPQ